MYRLIFLLFILISSISCLQVGDPYQGLPPGTWRGVLHLSGEDEVFEEESNAELPFNFEVIYDKPDSFYIVIHNAEERIIVNDITMGTDRRTGRDTIRIDFPVYDSHIQAAYEEDAIEGWWVARNRKDYQIKFTAKHGQQYRFFQNPDPPKVNVTGRWECFFGLENESQDTSIGVFHQSGNILTGTFMNPTGDDRYLEGIVSGERLFLSVFDGSHAYLYEAKILDDGQLSGIYRSGKHFKTYWQGKRNDTIELTDLGDPMRMTFLKNDKEVFSISLPDPEGNVISLNDPEYSGKPKVIQIMGTWCPNCRDETDFLIDYIKHHPDPGFEIIGIAFERHTDPEKAKAAIRTYRSKMGIPYEILYGGSNDKTKASEVLLMLNKVAAFPTLIFLDAGNQVVAIHTGFSGPATTGYEAFKKEFDVLIQKIVSVE